MARRSQRARDVVPSGFVILQLEQLNDLSTSTPDVGEDETASTISRKLGFPLFR